MHQSDIETLIHCTEKWRFRSAQHRYVAASFNTPFYPPNTTNTDNMLLKTFLPTEKLNSDCKNLYNEKILCGFLYPFFVSVQLLFTLFFTVCPVHREWKRQTQFVVFVKILKGGCFRYNNYARPWWAQSTPALSLPYRIRNSHPNTHLPHPTSINCYTNTAILILVHFALVSKFLCGPVETKTLRVAPAPPRLTKWDNCEDRLFVVKKNTNRWEGTRSGRARGYGHPNLRATHS